MILVIVFHLGVAGVVIATVISNVLSSSLVMIGIPAGIQGAIFSVSNVFIQFLRRKCHRGIFHGIEIFLLYLLHTIWYTYPIFGKKGAHYELENNESSPHER